MASPTKQESAQPAHVNNNDGQDGQDGDLALSLQGLTITTSSPARTPRASRPDKSPSSPLPRSVSSRSATPTLLRKASMNSLHSASGVPPSSRRASSASVLSPSKPRSGRSPLRSMSPEPPPKPAPTPHSVASAHFRAELDIHHGPEPTRRAETVVILHDACYGHRYARPRTSRAQLSTIVERPERIRACALGVSAAYVRLGERHQDGAFPLYVETDAASLPSIPFRIQKSSRRLSLASQTVTNVHGTKWMEELKMMCDTAEAKLAGGGKELQRPEMDRGPGAEAPQKFHEGDLYLCSESLEALEGALGGVCDAVDAVFRPQGPQRAFVAVRPPGHHCSAAHPSGFCWINNVHVGIMHAVLSHGLTHAAIIDFDLHHGDGSQAIAWQHNARGVGLAKNAAWWKKTSIGYFSLHDINSYPCEMGDEDKVRNASICIDSAHGQSIWNVHLQPWKTEADFWALYESRYAVLLDKTRAYLKSHTERLRASGLNSRAAIFLSAGFDASEYEGSGMQRHNVNVPTEFYARFTRDVVRIAAEEGTSVEGRIISVLEGGYSDRALCSGVFSHLCGLAGDGPNGGRSTSSSRDRRSSSIGSGYDAQQSLQQRRARKDSTASERGARRYESSWWSLSELESLEETVRTPPPAPKLVRTSPPPTYSSPTQSSQARAVTPKNRRSISGLSRVPSNGALRVSSVSYEPPPPPPDVPWTVAALELSKLLIPSGRSTTSCTAEDLNAEATRARRERQAALAGPVPLITTPATTITTTSTTAEDRPPTRMGLRERKAKPAIVGDELDRKSRRKTVAGPAVLATEAGSRGPTPPVPGTGKQSRASRRLSAASTVVSSVSDGLGSAGSVSVSSDAAPVPVPLPPGGPVRANSKTDGSGSVEGSAVGVPGTGGGGGALNVKKTRAPAKPRAKKPASAANGTAGPSTAGSVSGASATGKGADDVDKLAGEMKKIKITVVTKAQKEARERERVAREKLALERAAQEQAKQAGAASVSAPSPPGKSTSPPPPASFASADAATPSDSTSITVNQNNGHLPSPTPSPAPQVQSPLEAPTTPFALEQVTTPNLSTPITDPLVSPPTTDPRRVPLPASSPPAPSPEPQQPHGLGSDPIQSPTTTTTQRPEPGTKTETDLETETTPLLSPPPPQERFIPYQPDVPTAQGTPQHRPQPPQTLQWMPPNVCATPVRSGPGAGMVASPSPVKRGDLPVFTSTGVIPFAPPPPLQGQNKAGTGVGGAAGRGGGDGVGEGSS